MGIIANLAGVVTKIEGDVREAEQIEAEFVADIKALVAKYGPFINQGSVIHSGGSLTLNDLRGTVEPTDAQPSYEGAPSELPQVDLEAEAAAKAERDAADQAAEAERAEREAADQAAIEADKLALAEDEAKAQADAGAGGTPEGQ